MTFQSELDVWQTEELRTSPSHSRPTTRELIRLAAGGAFGAVSWAVAPLGWRSALPAWTRAWRLMLARKIGWAALLFASICARLDTLTWRNAFRTPLMRREPLARRGREVEVDAYASA